MVAALTEHRQEIATQGRRDCRLGGKAEDNERSEKPSVMHNRLPAAGNAVACKVQMIVNPVVRQSVPGASRKQ
jgi:hypothetical protein